MSMTAFSSRVYLLRHGELTTKDVLAGHTDFILSKKGFEQLNIACGRLANIDLVTSSSLKRCSEFARQFCDFNKIPLNITDDIKSLTLVIGMAKAMMNCGSILKHRQLVTFGKALGS